MSDAPPSGGAPAASSLTRLVVFSVIVLGSGWIGLLVDDALGDAHSLRGQGSLVWIMTPILTGAVLASAGLGIGLSGQLVALLRLAAGNRISRAAALFQVAQNLGYGVGIGVPMALILALGDTVTPDARVHLFLGCSLILLVTGLVLALRKPKNRVAAQRDSEE